MKISDFVAELEKIKAEHGDLDVERYFEGGAYEAKNPVIDYRLILKGKEWRPRFFSSSYSASADDDAIKNRRGEKVCRI